MNSVVSAVLIAVLWLAMPGRACADGSHELSGIKLLGVSGASSIQAVTGVSNRVERARRDPDQNAGFSVASGAVTGDNVSDPFVIPSLPYLDAGSTVGLTDDYFEACPFPDSGAPDAVYRYIPSVSGFIEIDLCQSLFDTRVFVYANTVTPGSPYACNDDYCGTFYFRSRIASLPVSAGTTYFIVVDGWGDESGEYSLSVANAVECVWSGCSPEAVMESEVCSPTTDVTNGGCNTAAHNFGVVNFGEPICGAVWAQLPSRDTDWFRKGLSAGTAVRWAVRAEFPVSLFVFDLSGGCDALSGLRIDGDPCEEIAITFEPESDADFAFVVTTREQYGGYSCASGSWQYEAVLDFACACDCNADPFDPAGDPGTCDGVVDVLDVTAVVNSAFRGFAIIPDPNAACPYVRADANCDGAVDILDVTAIVNVAFRGFVPGVVFCNPCPG